MKALALPGFRGGSGAVQARPARLVAFWKFEPMVVSVTQMQRRISKMTRLFKYIGGTIVVAVLGGGIPLWLNGSLNQFFPSPSQAQLALSNARQDIPPRSENGFRIVLCWLKNDDSGKDTGAIAEAFSGVDGIVLVRSARIVTGAGAGAAWRDSMQNRARAVMEDWKADLAIAGVAKKPGEVMKLWFVPRLGEGTLDRGDQSYTLQEVKLGRDFHDDLRAQLTTSSSSQGPPSPASIRSLISIFMSRLRPSFPQFAERKA